MVRRPLSTEAIERGFMQSDETPEHDTMVMWTIENERTVVRPHLGDVGDLVKATWEHALPCGYVDVLLEYERGAAAVECKPTIPSVGATIRQVGKYARALGDSARVVLVSADARFRSVFESQGIAFAQTPGAREIHYSFGYQAGLARGYEVGLKRGVTASHSSAPEVARGELALSILNSFCLGAAARKDDEEAADMVRVRDALFRATGRWFVPRAFQHASQAHLGAVPGSLYAPPSSVPLDNPLDGGR